MLFLLSSLFLISARGLVQFDYMTNEMDPDPGPSLASAYVPGTPGDAWTGEELESTRYRILQAIHPDWAVKEEICCRKKCFNPKRRRRN